MNKTGFQADSSPFLFFFLHLRLQFPLFTVTQNQVVHMKTLYLWAWSAL